MDTCSAVGLAARTGNLEALKLLLSEGKPANVKDRRGWFPLHEAADAGHTNCLVWLLKQEKLDINWKTFEGETALLLACRKGQAACAEQLINSGANIDLSNNRLYAPLHKACQNGSLECARLLLEAGCDVNCRTLRQSTVLREFRRGDLPTTTTTTAGAYTPLHLAIEGYPFLHRPLEDLLPIVNLLLEYNADICSYGFSEETPVFMAAQKGYVDCLKLLLEKAKQQGKQFVVNMTDDNNASPFCEACRNGHVDCVELLLDNGADPGIQSVLVGLKSIYKSRIENITTHMDALQHATIGNHKRCLQLLLQRLRKDPRLYKCNQVHPLMLAIKHKTTDCLKLLVENGFDVKQVFYKRFECIGDCDEETYASEERFGSLLCFSPSLEAARYILEQESDLKKLFKPAKPNNGIRLLNPVLTSFSDMQLLNLILRYGAKMEETDTFFIGEKVIPTARLPLCLYLLVRYGCQTRKWFQNLQNYLPRYSDEYIYFFYFVIFGMLLTPNIEIDHRSLDILVNNRTGLLTTQLSQQIKEDSHTLKYACRSAIVRHMISLDQWNREGLEKLGVPELIQDYLSYLEYGILGDFVRRLVQEGKKFVRTGCYDPDFVAIE